MGTVLTTTQANPLAPPGQPAVTYEPYTGNLYTIGRTGADTLGLYRSANNGTSWTLQDSFTHTGLQEWSGLVLDTNNNGHLMYRIGTSGGGGIDAVYYRRVDMRTDTFGGGFLSSSADPNGGTIGSVWQGVDCAVIQKNSSTTYIAWVGGYGNAGKYGLCLATLTLTMPSGTVVKSYPQLLSGNRFWTTTGNLISNRVAPYIEAEHAGNGYAMSSTPNLWISYGRSKLSLIRCAWNGNGWNTPASPTTIRSTMGNAEYSVARWDGTAFLQCIVNPDDTTSALVYERNKSNTTTTIMAATPAHPTGAIRHLAVTYDRTTRDIRVYAIGTSTDVLYFTTFGRTGQTWAGWATVTATAILGAATIGAEFGTRRGGTSDNAKYDVITAHSGSPNTVVSAQQSITSAPQTPTWDTSAQPYVNGGAADVGAALTLDWVFFDVDPGSTQGSYAVSRQIGAGALQYWNASTTSWGGTEVQNTSATSALTLASGWALDADAPYTFRVKVWDNTGTPSPGYSAGLQLTPSAKSNPTITAPTVAQVITVDQVTVTWTVADQASRRVRLLTNPGGDQLDDTGYETTTDLSYTVPTRLPNGTGYTVELTTRNAEGLASTVQTRSFTVAYAPAAAPTSTLTALPATGVIRVQAVQLAAVGSQPTTTALALYRRKVTTSVLNANPSFAGNVTGWIVGGGGTPGTLTYSTTQFHDGPGAARFVPPAAGPADPGVESSAFTNIAIGSRYIASAWVRPDTANKPIKIRLMWYDNSNVFQSSTELSVGAVAGAWHFVYVVGDANNVAGANKVRVSAGLGSTPAAGDAFYVDEVQLKIFDPDEGIRVAEGEPIGVTIDDYGPAALTDYEYRWLATGANGTTVYGPWTS